MPVFQVPHLATLPKQAFFKALVIFLFCIAGCGGSGLGFPQGPTSGADDLGMIVPQVSLRPHADFRLAVAYDAESSSLDLQWQAPENENCESYRLALIDTPQGANAAGIAKAKLLSLTIDTHELTFAADDFIAAVQSESRPVSIVIFCVSPDQHEITRSPLPRSNIENLTELLLDASS